jgi:hypothetical protein
MRSSISFRAVLALGLLAHGIAHAKGGLTLSGLKQDLVKLGAQQKNARGMSGRMAGKLASAALPVAEREKMLGHFDEARALAESIAQQSLRDPTQHYVMGQREVVRTESRVVGGLTAQPSLVINGVVHVNVDKREGDLFIRRRFRMDAAGLSHLDTMAMHNEVGRYSHVLWREDRGTVEATHRPGNFGVTRTYDSSGKRLKTFHGGLLQDYFPSANQKKE